MDQEVRPKRKLKLRKSTEKASVAGVETSSEIFLDVDRPTSKDKDFDLDLDAAKFQGRKGQAGTRTRSMPGGDSPPAAAMSQFDPGP